MRRYVILRHDHPFLHWDLLLEETHDCRTWRLLNEPAPGRTVQAEPLPAHRLHYLTYEGPVSGDRGTVSRFDAGTYEIATDRPGRLEVRLLGGMLAGWCVIDDAEASMTMQSA